MMEKTMPVSQREGYTPTRWTRFLWWLSTADADLLKDCVVDRGRYAITGMTVLGTGYLPVWHGLISLAR